MNEKSRPRGARHPQVEPPEENVSVIAYLPAFSALEFDRDHGAEVEWAAKHLADYLDPAVH